MKNALPFCSWGVRTKASAGATDAAGAASIWTHFTHQTAAISWHASASAFLRGFVATQGEGAIQEAIATVCWWLAALPASCLYDAGQ